jgi:hypothetical protein
MINYLRSAAIDTHSEAKTTVKGEANCVSSRSSSELAQILDGVRRGGYAKL